MFTKLSRTRAHTCTHAHIHTASSYVRNLKTQYKTQLYCKQTWQKCDLNLLACKRKVENRTQRNKFDRINVKFNYNERIKRILVEGNGISVILMTQLQF